MSVALTALSLAVVLSRGGESSPRRCSDPAADKFTAPVVGPVVGAAGGDNRGCAYSCANLLSRFAPWAGSGSDCFIEGSSSSTWPPGPVAAENNTFSVWSGRTIAVQGFASGSAGAERSPLTMRLDAIGGSLVLRHVSMAGHRDTPRQPSTGWPVHFPDDRSSEPQKDGGAVFVHAGNLTVEHSIFRGNQATGWGGAIAVWGDLERPVPGTSAYFVRIAGSSFSGNLARDADGGAVAVWQQARLEITDCVFEGNSAGVPNEDDDGMGGAVSTESVANVSIARSRFIGNQAATQGGAVLLGGIPHATISDCVFVNNTLEPHDGMFAWTGLEGPIYPPDLSVGWAVQINLEAFGEWIAPFQYNEIIGCHGSGNYRVPEAGAAVREGDGPDRRAADCAIAWDGSGSKCLSEARIDPSAMDHWSSVSVSRAAGDDCRLPAMLFEMHQATRPPASGSVGGVPYCQLKDDGDINVPVGETCGLDCYSGLADEDVADGFGVASCVYMDNEHPQAKVNVALGLWHCACPRGAHLTSIAARADQGDDALCTACPPHSTTIGADSATVSSCSCGPGYLGSLHTEADICKPVACSGPPGPNMQPCSTAHYDPLGGAGAECVAHCAPGYVPAAAPAASTGGKGQQHQQQLSDSEGTAAAMATGSIFTCTSRGTWARKVPPPGGSGGSGQALTCIDPCRVSMGAGLWTSPCLHGGICTATATAFNCSCMPGFGGRTCTPLSPSRPHRGGGATGGNSGGDNNGALDDDGDAEEQNRVLIWVLVVLSCLLGAWATNTVVSACRQRTPVAYPPAAAGDGGRGGTLMMLRWTRSQKTTAADDISADHLQLLHDGRGRAPLLPTTPPEEHARSPPRYDDDDARLTFTVPSSSE